MNRWQSISVVAVVILDTNVSDDGTIHRCLCFMKTLAWQLYSICCYCCFASVSPETHSEWLDACLLDDKIYSIKPHVNAVPHAYTSLTLTLALSFTQTTFEIHLMKRSTSALHRYQIHAYMHGTGTFTSFCLMADALTQNTIHLFSAYMFSIRSTKATIELKIAHGLQQYTSIFRLLPFNPKCLGPPYIKPLFFLFLSLSHLLRMVAISVRHSFFHIHNQIVEWNEGQWLPWNIHYLLFACVTGSVHKPTDGFACQNLIRIWTLKFFIRNRIGFQNRSIRTHVCWFAKGENDASLNYGYVHT